MANLGSILKVLLPKKSNPQGVSTTPTFNPSNTTNILALPTFRDHLTDIFTNRTALDNRDLLKSLFVTDPDMSAAVNAFLTVANTQPIMLVKDDTGQIDTAGQEILHQLLISLTTRTDYTSQGFKILQSMNFICESMRYMVLLRGLIGAELVVTKEFTPGEIRMVDGGKLEWYEKAAGQYTPRQRSLTGQIIELDIPTFFVTWFRRDPTTIYSQSPFVSAINTVAARQQVINDLYRIMKITGFPRMTVKVMEEVLMKNAPASVKLTPETQQQYLRSQLTAITNSINSIGPEQTFIHYDSIEPGMMNEKNPGHAMNIDSVIGALNAQNQASLRTMATIIGRGTAGVNTATVEARVFSMNAEAINEPIADILSQIFTMALRLQGSQSYVEVSFTPVELRSENELETNNLIKAQRLRADLSLGLITDEEYHLKMYGRLPPPGAPVLSGTGFEQSGVAGEVDATGQPVSNDSLTRSAAGPRATKPARSNAMGKSSIKK